MSTTRNRSVILMTEIKNDIPYVAYESALVRADRTNRRLWILCIILAVFLVASNVCWIIYENQFEDVTTITQEASTDDGGTAIVNNDGEVHYGEGKADN